jgi:hypothetical protein
LTIILLVEGKTEKALREVLKRFLDNQATRKRRPKVRLKTKLLDSGLLNQERVRDQVALSFRDPEVGCVVGLVDVYPRFASAKEAKGFLRQAATGEPRFHPHAAQFEVEAWLLPFWQDICHRLGVQRKPPRANPEQVNLQKPPSRHFSELYRLASRTYDKPRDLLAILQGKDLRIVAEQCPEFKAFLSTLLICAGLTPLQ